MTRDDLTEQIIGLAMQVHSAVGPGVLERVYEACLAHDLSEAGLAVERQIAVPIRYRDLKFDEGFRIDLLVEKRVVVEIKAVENILPVHKAQLITYLKLMNLDTGLLLNFHEPKLKDGIFRGINKELCRS